MSKKYVIEIKPEYEANGIMILGARDSHLYVTTLEVKDLEELNSDYINEYFGDLQDTAYQRGLDDAWEYAKKIVLNPDDGGLGLSELNEIFGFYTIQSIFKNYTVQQAIEKLKAYEKEQKANDEIKVGDEVISRRSERKGILLEPEVGDTFATVIVPSERWRTYCIRQADLTKTGKHYNIEDLLKAMNG